MKFALLILAFLAAAPPEKDVPKTAQDEILRLGDAVQDLSGIAEGPEAEFSAAMGPPADDSGKWFLTVIGMKGCSHCDRLKKDLAEHRAWQAFVNIADPKDPNAWAHYNAYQREDKSQADRLAEYQVRGYPTIVVQTPRNGRFGAPGTIVVQITGYTTAEETIAAIQEGVKAYCAKLSQEKQAAADSTPRAGGIEQTGGAFDPPWTPVSPSPAPAPNSAPPFSTDIPPKPATPAVPSASPGSEADVMFNALKYLAGLILGPTSMVYLLAGLKVYQTIGPRLGLPQLPGYLGGLNPAPSQAKSQSPSESDQYSVGGVGLGRP